MRTYIAPFESLNIGGEEITNTKLRFADTEGLDFDLLLGADFFLSHRVYVSNAQHRLYLTYNGVPVFVTNGPPPSKPTPAGDGQAALTTDVNDPTDAEGYSRRGAARASRRDLEAAIADFDKAVTMAPTEPRYLVQRAMARLAGRQVFRAKADLDAALKLKPDYVDALLVRARMFLLDRDRVSSRAAGDAAAREADFRLGIAGLYGAFDARREAIGQYDLWIAAHPVDSRMPEARNGRCWARALAGVDLDKAIDDCSIALRARPKTAQYLDSRGLARLRSGDLPRAIDDYDASLEIAPQIGWSLYGRGLAKLCSGQTEEGNRDIAAAMVIAPRLTEQARGYGIIPMEGEPR